jgi:hypothetical protein
MTEDYGRTHVPVGTVSKEWIHDVETYQKKKLIKIGKFNLLYLQDMIDILYDNTFGDIELFMIPGNTLADGSKSGLLVAKFDDEYVALAGIATKSEPNKNP